MPGKTKRLYFEDPYRVEFDTRVIERITHEGNPAVILDQTCFYPEGGGQPADKGTLAGIPVINVFEQDERIIHVLESDIPEGAVKGSIDWGTRLDHMQQHAGQHILSQCFVRLYDAATRSFHLGEKRSTLEVDMRKISEEEAERAEKLANEIVFQNREIRSCFYMEDAIADVDLRRPPKKEGEIRVVEISDFDHTACGGTHPHRTGEIGPIKILKWDRIRDNVRMEFICGIRAFQDYARKHRDLKVLSNNLTIDDSEVLAAFEKMVSDLKAQKKANRKLLEALVRYEAAAIVQKAEGNIVVQIFEERSHEEVRLLTLAAMREGDFICLFGLRGEERAFLFLACSENLDLDMRELVPVVSPLIEGKGGGRPSLVEISGKKRENLEIALEAAARHICEKL
jgi:alanyl-tRNA synthetase